MVIFWVRVIENFRQLVEEGAADRQQKKLLSRIRPLLMLNLNVYTS